MSRSPEQRLPPWMRIHKVRWEFFARSLENSPNDFHFVCHLASEAKGMKVIAFNGSPRQNGNTNKALEIALEELHQEGIETELVQMGSEDIHGCKGCGSCGKNKDEKCIFDGDKVNQWVQMIKHADGIIIGSPTYFGGLSSQTKAFIDRVGYVGRANGGMLRRKVGAAVAIKGYIGNSRQIVVHDIPEHDAL